MSALGRLTLVLLGLLLLALWLPVSELLRPAGRAGHPELVIVSPHWEGIRYEFGRAFERHMAARGRPVKVTWLNPGGTSASLRFVRSRFAEHPEGTGVDLFFGGGVDPFLSLGQDGLLQPVPLPEEIRAAVPREIAGAPVYDPEQGWYGNSLTTFGIVYNRALLARLGLPEPRSFADLGEPALRGWLALADPRSSGSVHMIYELILQTRGFEQGFRLITRMLGNARHVVSFTSEVPIEVGASEVACGTTIDSYAWAQVAALGADSLGFAAPPGETIVNADAIGLLKGAPSPALAREFLLYTLGPEGQALWMLPPGAPGGPERYHLGRFPVRPDVFRRHREAASMSLDPFVQGPRIAYDGKLGSARWSVLNALVGGVLGDAHRELAGAWAELVGAGRPAEAEELLTRPPLGEAEALAAGQAFRDPLERNRLVARWSQETRARIEEARRLIREHARGRDIGRREGAG